MITLSSKSQFSESKAFYLRSFTKVCYHLSLFFLIFIFFRFIYLFSLQYCIGFAIHWHESPWVYMCSPSWTPLSPPSPSHPSGSSQCTSLEHLSFKILIYNCVLSIFCCQLWVYSLGSVSCSVVSNSLWPHEILSMDFSRQEYWSGLPLPTPGNLHDSRIKPGSPAFQADSLPSEPPRKPYSLCLLSTVMLLLS